MTPLTTSGVILFDGAKNVKTSDVFIAKVETIKGVRRVTLVRQKDPLEGRTENDLIIKELLTPGDKTK